MHRPYDSLLWVNLLLRESKRQSKQGSLEMVFADGRGNHQYITSTTSNFPSFLFFIVITRLSGKQGIYIYIYVSVSGKNKLTISHIVSQMKLFKRLPVHCVQVTENFMVIISPFSFSCIKSSSSL